MSRDWKTKFSIAAEAVARRDRVMAGLRKLPSPKRLEALGERFRRYRTVAAWYCWRAVHEHREQDG